MLYAATLLSLLITSNVLLAAPADVQAQTLQQLEQDIATLTSKEFYGRKTNTVGAKRAAKYLTERFASLGYAVQTQDFQYQGNFFQKAQARNIIATHSRTCHTCKLIILTAHYDHLGLRGNKLYPGANDNASGVAALLYLATHFADKPHHYQLMFVATDAEENGLHGSEYLVSTVNKDKIKLNINLDMLVVNTRKPRIYAFLDKHSLAKYQAVIKNLSNEQVTFIATSSSARLNRIFDSKINWLRASDHYSFAKADIPYIYFGVGLDKHHHQTTDSIAHIDFVLLTQVVEKIAAFIEQLTN